MIKYNQKIDDIQVLLPILKPFGTRSWPRTVQLGVGARLAAESSFFFGRVEVVAQAVGKGAQLSQVGFGWIFAFFGVDVLRKSMNFMDLPGF